MATQEQPQIYLITPPQIEPAGFAGQLKRVLDRFAIACVRLRLSAGDADTIGRAADLLRETCHAAEVPLIIDSHYRLVKSHGLDGVHLPDGARQLRDIRKQLGGDAIIGGFCGASRHAGLTAAEMGADYVSFGPVSDTALGDGTIAELETFKWWSQMIELPVVAEGYVTLQAAEKLAPVTDFFALGQEIWGADEGPEAALQAYLTRIS